MKASQNGHLKVVEVLLDRGADANAASIAALEQPQPRHQAGHGRLDLLGLLLDRGPALDVANSIGWSAAMAASCGGKLEVVTLLAIRGATIRARFKHHGTARHIAARQA